jgi:hypothetical protein
MTSIAGASDGGSTSPFAFARAPGRRLDARCRALALRGDVQVRATARGATAPELRTLAEATERLALAGALRVALRDGDDAPRGDPPRDDAPRGDPPRDDAPRGDVVLRAAVPLERLALARLRVGRLARELLVLVGRDLRPLVERLRVDLRRVLRWVGIFERSPCW